MPSSSRIRQHSRQMQPSPLCIKALNEAERYAAIRSRLEKADRAMILFADKMPRTLN